MTRIDPAVTASILASPGGPHWQRLGLKRRTGVYVPLFSLRSLRQVGVGDLADLADLVSWCGDEGIDVIQLLPLNDMGPDSVPYGAISAFALDPVYIALDRLPGVQASPELRGQVASAAAMLAPGDRVGWEAVRRIKGTLLRLAWREERGPATLDAMASYRGANPWMEAYLPYRVQRERTGWRSWEEWGRDTTPGELLAALEHEAPEELEFCLWCQWTLDRQLREVRTGAAARGVLIKGDIPILVSRDSADVWAHRNLFLADTSAGAPPDMYALDGQNWGFPTYAWDEHRADGFRWWRQRLAVAERYYDLYRIDHVVGFFRIWTIPAGPWTGRHGRFVPEDEARWGSHGREILEMMLSASPMLPLAEDLGTIPPVCRSTLSELGICGMKVQRWERNWHGDRRFLDPGDYPALSLATVSTHDSELLAEWWRTFPGDRQDLWELLGRGGPAAPELDADTHRAILRRVGGGGSLFVIYMIQELLAPLGLLPGAPGTHRVNVPGTVGPHNWTWRCPVDVHGLPRGGTVRDLFGIETCVCR